MLAQKSAQVLASGLRAFWVLYYRSRFAYYFQNRLVPHFMLAHGAGAADREMLAGAREGAHH
jgi:hypothetical protein